MSESYYPSGFFVSTSFLQEWALLAVMKKISRFIYLLVLLAAVGGLGFLVAWDIPLEPVKVEKIIPDERLPR